MIIGFSGHRDCRTTREAMMQIYQRHKKDIWAHGGCKQGFDDFLHFFIKCFDLKYEIYRPKYDKFHYKQAPLERNKEIVINSRIMYFCYDGRTKGGTYQTYKFATKCNKEIILLPCIDITTEAARIFEDRRLEQCNLDL